MKRFARNAFAALLALTSSLGVHAQERVYTTGSDFSEGTFSHTHLPADPDGDQVELDDVTMRFPYVGAALGLRGTVVRIDPQCGEVLGEYFSAPDGDGRSPARATIDYEGNIWVGNRAEDTLGLRGSVTQIGLVVGGFRADENGLPHPLGEYLVGPFDYCTCVDRNMDGRIRTSSGLGHLLPWTGDQQDPMGGPAFVRDAEDECIRIYQCTDCPNIRHVSIDPSGDVWVAGYPQFNPTCFQRLSHIDGHIMQTIPVYQACGGLAGIVDPNGFIWSSDPAHDSILYVHPSNPDNPICIGGLDSPHGVDIDASSQVLVAGYAQNQIGIFAAGTMVDLYPVAGASGLLALTVRSQDDSIWVTSQLTNEVYRLDSAGVVTAVIPTFCDFPAGIAEDAQGRIWVVGDGSADRIDPSLNEIDLVVSLPSMNNPWNPSEMTGPLSPVAIKTGVWTVVYDSGLPGARFGRVTWNSEPEGVEPTKTKIEVCVRSAEEIEDLPLSDVWHVRNGHTFEMPPGRFLQVEVELRRAPDVFSGPVLSDLKIEVLNADCPCYGAEEGDPISLRSGDFTEDRQDLYLPGKLLDVALAFRYRSGSVYDGPFGYGWDMSSHRRMRKLENDNVLFSTGLNWTWEFVYDPATGTYLNPMQFEGTLTENLDGSFSLVSIDGTRQEFDRNGTLERIEERNGNGLDFVHTPNPEPILGENGAVVGSEHLLLEIIDTVGRSVTFEYNTSNRLASLICQGRTVTYRYAPSNNGDLVAVTMPATQQFPSGTTTTYDYDGEHNLSSITDAQGQVYLTNTYSETGQMDSQVFGPGTFQLDYGPSVAGITTTDVVDPRGVRTQYSFDSHGRLVREETFTDGMPSSEPLSYVTTQEYGSGGHLARTVLPRRNAIEYQRSATGKVTEVRLKPIGAPPWVGSPSDLVVSYTYESLFDLVKTTTDPLGRTATFIYDYELGENPHGNLRKIVLPPADAQTPAGEMVFMYSAFGQVATITDQNAQVTQLIRDAITGYVTSVIRGFGTPEESTTNLAYDLFGNIVAVMDPNGNQAIFEYDTQDHLISETSPAPFSFKTHYRYDANGNLVQVDRQTATSTPAQLPPLGSTVSTDGWQSTVYTYTTLDQLASVTDDLGQITSYMYDADGNLQGTVDADGGGTSFEHHEGDLIWRIIDAATPAGVTEFLYDANENLVELTDAKGNATVSAYDDFDRLIRLTYANNTFELFGHDRSSNVTSWSRTSSDLITYQYDGLDRLIARVTSDEVVSYDYDAGDRLTEAANDHARIEWTYDALDRVRTTQRAIGSLSPASLLYEYDDVGNRTKLVYPDGYDLRYFYDALSRLTRIEHPNPFTGSPGGPAPASDVTAIYRYDPLGRRTSLIHGNGISTIYEYDPVSRLTGIGHLEAGGPIESIRYGYDVLGNRDSRDDGFGSHVFAYDALSQLTSADFDLGHPLADAAFTYDAVGNRTEVVEGGTPVTYVANSLNQYSSVGGVTFSYDANGNLTGDGINSYLYDIAGRLVAASGPFGSVEYSIGPLGERVSASSGGQVTHFIYDGPNLIQELDSGGTVLESYALGSGVDEVLIKGRGTNRLHYLADGVGSAVLLCNGQQDVVEVYAYDAFGEPQVLAPDGTPRDASAYGNRFLFTGREYDAGPKLYHLRNRALHPGIGRFLQRDPLGYLPDVNLYRYVGNNPLLFMDPFGFSKGVGQPGLIASAVPVVGNVWSAVDHFQNGHPWWGALHTGLAILDVIPVRAAAGIAFKGGTAAIRALRGAQRAEAIGSAARGAARWGNPNTLARHFRDHGADFGAKCADDYARLADDFLERSQKARLPTKVGPDGTIRVYDPATNTFGAFNPDGTTKTFFKPSNPNYFDGQLGDLIP